MSGQQEIEKWLHDKLPENVTTKSLTSYKMLAKNTLWNFSGQVAPLLVAIAAIPFLVKGLGVERFGVLMLVLMLIGYFSVFDVGLGRALTKIVAEKLGSRRSEEIPKIVWTAIVLMGVLGFLGATVLVLLGPWFVHNVLKIPEALQMEALGSWYLISISIPIVISTVGLGGVLEAYQRFDLTNAMRIPLGLFTFLSPLLVLIFSKNLISIVAVLVAGRIGYLIAHLWFCLKVLPALCYFSVNRSYMRPLFSFGSWMTVSNIISPLMVYMDRFFISVLVSITAVAYYSTPQEMVIKMMVIPSALVGVLFPVFSSCLVSDRARAAMIFDRSISFTFLVMFPISLVIVTLAKEILQFWLGLEFAKNSTVVLQWLTVGLFFNSLSGIFFAMVQAEGRPDLTAKLHLFELPIYLLLFGFLLNKLGIQGAAIAWSIRIALDMLLLSTITYRYALVDVVSIRRLSIMIFAALILFALSGITNNLIQKIIFLVSVLSIFSLTSWFLIFNRGERDIITKLFK